MPSLPRIRVCILQLLLVLLLPLTGFADDEEQDELRFFETKIRPLFVEHCYECHGPKLQESELRLDTTEGILLGGAAGPAIVESDPDQSLLLVALSYREDDLQMPPSGKLEDDQIADIRRWIESGAVLPKAAGSVKPRRGAIDMEQARQFWSFQPPQKAALPQVQNSAWPQAALDHFVLAQLESKQLAPAPAADKRTLIRRVTFDLIGLPPTPAEVDAFLADESPAAFARVVDRLLNSTHYGERWGRHWLDVARYADSNGLDENIAHGNAWRYRDYVIASLNADKPFDEFVMEQLAGDLLPAGQEPQRYEHLIATGFLSLGPKVLAEGDERKMEVDIIDEQIDTIGRAFMGLTLGCARCHDHKFDPIRTDDYYALAGIFKSTRTMESFKRIAKWNENSIATADQIARKEDLDRRIAEHKTSIQQVTEAANAELQGQLSNDAALPKDAESRYSQESKDKLKQLRDELTALEAALPVLPTAMGVVDAEPMNTQVHIRGSHLSLGKEIERGVLEVITLDGQPAIGEKQSGRLQLAHWLVRPEHPLTSRVIVNRMWRWHFGRGLVGSTDNFGNLGDQPVNQPLLDFLSVRLMESGWSVKELHREIVLSSTYQMSTANNAAAAGIDPENHLQWRANLRRIEAEAIRDSLLAVSGLLDTEMGGSMLHVANRAFVFDHTSKDETTYDTTRRSVYLPVIRNHLFDVFSLFDYSDASVPTGDRSTSTIAPQALFLMNSDFLARTSQAFAERLTTEVPSDPKGRVTRLYELAFGRPPSNSETEQALAFVAAVEDNDVSTGSGEAATPLRGWEALCHVMIECSEFLHVQ
ncbi:MAG: PSD1 and planctomycete cytochrome C domain-containing protein [Planctomycetota bacterium]|nr:PSD1 and planctomycete cytochrome C domain-containing protein [Planctomycetota bacterium]